MAAGIEEHAQAVVMVLERWREPKDWHEQAACRGLGPDLFFPPVTARTAPEAVAVCRDCPVAEECSEAGENERHGVWGGRLRWTTKTRPPKSPLSGVHHRYERGTTRATRSPAA